MATSTGKTLGLLLLIFLIVFVFIVVNPFSHSFFHGIFPKMISHHNGIQPIEAYHMFLFPSVLFIFWLIVTIWVYIDAERRKLNGFLWGSLVFVGNVIGLIIYLLVRTGSTPVVSITPQVTANSPQTCPACSKPVRNDFNVCPHCGTSLKMTCPACEKKVESDWKVCPYCAAKLMD